MGCRFIGSFFSSLKFFNKERSRLDLLFIIWLKNKEKPDTLYIYLEAFFIRVVFQYNEALEVRHTDFSESTQIDSSFDGHFVSVSRLSKL